MKINRLYFCKILIVISAFYFQSCAPQNKASVSLESFIDSVPTVDTNTISKQISTNKNKDAFFNFNALKSNVKIKFSAFDQVNWVSTPQKNLTTNGKPRYALLNTSPLIYDLIEGIEIGDTIFLYRNIFSSKEPRPSQWYNSFTFLRGYTFTDKSFNGYYLALFFDNQYYSQNIRQPYLILIRIQIVGPEIISKILFAGEQCCENIDCFDDYNTDKRIDFALVKLNQDTLWAFDLTPDTVKKIQSHYIILKKIDEDAASWFIRTIDKKKSQWFYVL